MHRSQGGCYPVGRGSRVAAVLVERGQRGRILVCRRLVGPWRGFGQYPVDMGTASLAAWPERRAARARVQGRVRPRQAVQGRLDEDRGFNQPETEDIQHGR